MTISFSPSVLVIVLCLFAGGLGAFVRYVLAKRGWADWSTFWAGVFVALLVFASFKIS